MGNLDLDIKSLTIFEALLREGNVSRVAQRLRVSQPTVSHSLSRLREAFGDPLFIRTRAGMIPTERALAIRPLIEEALAKVAMASQPKAVFLPQHDSRRFILATTDYMECIALASVAKTVLKLAPNIQLCTEPLRQAVPEAELESGAIDLALGHFPKIPPQYYQAPLFQEDFVAVIGAKQARQDKLKSVKDYVSYSHLLVAPWGGVAGWVDSLLGKEGESRSVRLSTTHFLSAPFLAMETGCLVTLPRRLAMLFAKSFPLKVLELPFKLPNLSFKMIWHARTHSSEAHRWLRSKITSACRAEGE